MFDRTLSPGFVVLVAATAVVIGAPASALEFRGVALGDSCAHAAEVERSLGTKPTRDLQQMLKSNLVTFEDTRVAKQRSEFVYDCTHTSGVISTYAITVTLGNESRARDTFAKAKVAATKRLGTAVDDSSFPEATNKLREMRLKGLTETLGFADWKSPDGQYVEVRIDQPLNQNGAGGASWKITTTVARQPP